MQVLDLNSNIPSSLPVLGSARIFFLTTIESCVFPVAPKFREVGVDADTGIGTENISAAFAGVSRCYVSKFEGRGRAIFMDMLLSLWPFCITAPMSRAPVQASASSDHPARQSPSKRAFSEMHGWLVLLYHLICQSLRS